MAQSDKVKEITQQLEDGIKNMFESENYKNYLQTMSKFRSYSFNNTVLIAMQKKDASLVAGFGTWKEMGRSIKKGEKSIKIIAPCIYKKEPDPDTVNPDGSATKTESEEKVIKGFKVVNVFDLSQTEGKELPEITKKLDGSVEGYADFMQALREFSPVPIQFEKIEGSANGYYSLTQKKIVIDEGMSEQMFCKTGLHEIAHSILHDRDNGTEKEHLPNTRTKEVQAESIAYTVSSYFGLDTSSYSFGYIAGWSSGKELSELRESMEVIKDTSKKMIEGIEEKLDGIRLSKTINADTVKDCISKDKKPKQRHRKH